MAKKISRWQRHAAPFLKRAIEQARKSYKPANGMTPARKKQVKSLQKRRDEINDRIRKLKGGR